jgi:hypothetical protein
MRAHPPFRFGAVVQTLLLSVLVSCAQGARSAAPGSKELKGPIPDFRREAVSTHIRALADDRFEGRATGTPGDRQAAGYVADQLRSLGIEPLGDNGTFFQEVPLRLARLESATLEVALGKGQRRVLEHERDFVRYHQPADEWGPTRDYQPLADFARFQFLVGLSVAQRADRPAWKQGDYFQRFARSRSSSQPPTN